MKNILHTHAHTNSKHLHYNTNYYGFKQKYTAMIKIQHVQNGKI